MIHTLELVLPANTAIAAPVREVVKVGACIIVRVSLEYPRGCYWLAHVRVMLRDHQLYPTTPGDWLESDGEMLTWQDNSPIIDSPYELIVEGYNEDTRYTHTVRMYLDVTELTLAGLASVALTPETAYIG